MSCGCCTECCQIFTVRPQGAAGVQSNLQEAQQPTEVDCVSGGVNGRPRPADRGKSCRRHAMMWLREASQAL